MSPLEPQVEVTGTDLQHCGGCGHHWDRLLTQGSGWGQINDTVWWITGLVGVVEDITETDLQHCGGCGHLQGQINGTVWWITGLVEVVEDITGTDHRLCEVVVDITGTYLQQCGVVVVITGPDIQHCVGREIHQDRSLALGGDCRKYWDKTPTLCWSWTSPGQITGLVG